MEYFKVTYEGDEKNGRMEGTGEFYYTSEGMRYDGEMKDGKFEGKGTIYFKSGAKLEGVWKEGRLQERKYFFKDGLEFNENTDQWNYCTNSTQEHDRRFYYEHLQAKQFHSQFIAPKEKISALSKDGLKPAIPNENQLDTLPKVIIEPLRKSPTDEITLEY
ncbi:hypothetical protein ABK040_016592 [Willaertia magna]